MPKSYQPEEILPLTRAAHSLSLSYGQAYAAALRGDLGEIIYRGASGTRLHVTRKAVARFRRLRQSGALKA